MWTLGQACQRPDCATRLIIEQPVAIVSVDKRVIQHACHIAPNPELSGRARASHRRAAEQIVDHQKTVIVVNQTNQSLQATVGVVDRVVNDRAILCVVGEDAGLGRAGNEVVSFVGQREGG